ncbi:MAG: S41 family peptidase [Calditrichae bacterium]|nr:S41 family peptidase [Calditrichota bacterium]MCB9058809.1 S41 family peptidase [Calditrichia bacterium]
MKRSTIVAGTALIFVLIIFYYSQTGVFFYIGNLNSEERENIQKLREVISLTKNYYVDKVDWNEATEQAINGMLHSLDPHSVYFNPEEAELNDESFDGKYQGIGIQYDVIEGYINVISVIPDSPSEKAGVYAGDVIVSIDGESAFGIRNAEVPKKLKGLKGTKVNIGIKRSGVDEELKFDIVRDEVPIFTINTSFMANDSTGYIWLNKFMSITADKLESELIRMEKLGMKQLIIDLRNNGGGFLAQAVRVVGKFISGHQKVVYTKGRIKEFSNEQYTDDYGKSIDRDYPLILLINQSSASASEIVAGALQDYDRALIVGERSFGKGLVQNEFSLNDDSRLRLTISKYYTPSGRLIQRPYKNKSLTEYYDLDNFDLDSLNREPEYDSTQVYYTKNGRKVYGGGGIKPDVEIPYEDYSKSPQLTRKLFEKRLFFEVASEFSSEHKYFKDHFDDFLTYKIKEKWFTRLKNAAIEKNIDFHNDLWEQDRAYIENRLKAEIARNIWSQNEFYRIMLQYDNQFDSALGLFDEARKIQQSIRHIEAKN